MAPKFPLNNVIVQKVDSTHKVKRPLYADNYWQINQQEFAMQVEGVGSFYASRGSKVEFAPLPQASLASVELYLNGSVYGAILHQRQILPLHGSCFAFQGTSVMLCGESGAGKSSITTAFCLDGAKFLTDDVTPIKFIEGKPFIISLSDRMKLWDNALAQLKQKKEGLVKIDPETEKYYFPMPRPNSSTSPLDLMFVIEVYEEEEVEIREITGADKFLTLNKEVYRWEFLESMPDNQKKYFQNMIDISNHVKIFRVKRPKNIPINKMVTLLKRYIN